MNKRLIATLGALVVIGVTVGVLSVNLIPQFGGNSEAEWADITTGRQLLSESDRILVAKYVDETTHIIPSISPVTGENTGSVTELYRRFKVVESMKGGGAEGDTIYVVLTQGSTLKTPNMGDITNTYEVVPMTQGESYVLFLAGFPRRSKYPSQYGDTVWTIAGEPGIAQVGTDGALVFKASERYKSENGTSGSESAAPFTLTKDEIARQGN